MEICVESNPCNCVASINNSSQTSINPCPPEADCLILCDLIVKPSDGVGPCGQAGTIDVNTGNHDIAICEENPLRWSMVSFSGEGIVSATITPEGILTWVTAGPNSSGEFGTVILKGCCGEYSSYMEVLIGVKDLCNCPECNDCNDCDPCTGECMENQLNLTVKGANKLTNTKIDGK